MLEHGALNRDARRRFGGRVGCDRTPMKVSSRINVEIVMVCRSSNHLAFLMSESGLCCDLSTATVRNIATTRVKVSPTRHEWGTCVLPEWGIESICRIMSEWSPAGPR